MRILLLLAFCSNLFAFTDKPWFAEPYSSVGNFSYEFNYYPSIANQSGSKYSSANNYLQFDVSVAFFDDVDIEAEVEFDATKMKAFGFESIGVSARKGYLNDLQGDFISLALGGNLRIVPPNRLYDPSTPYHNVANLEVNLSLGKEWHDYFDWHYRSWAFFALGEANKGYPWVRFDYHLQGNVRNTMEWELFLLSYFGLGGHSTIDLETFKGYYNVEHQSIDLGLTGSYVLGIWGKISLSCAYRVFAKSYPQYSTSAILTYTFPFSFF